jgi:hypothetical protein
MPGCAIRTALSAGPPAGNGTTILIGLVVNDCEKPPRGSATEASVAANTTRREIMTSLPFQRRLEVMVAFSTG